jgi:hypothetical protein
MGAPTFLFYGGLVMMTFANSSIRNKFYGPKKSGHNYFVGILSLCSFGALSDTKGFYSENEKAR